MSFFKSFAKNTASVLKTFNKAVEDLKQIELRETENMEKADKKIAEQYELKAVADAEKTKASKVRAKIENLISVD